MIDDTSLTGRPADAEVVKEELAYSAQRIHTLLGHIHERNRRNLEDAVNIGQELHKAKHQLPHGEFGPWLQSNFDMSRTEATRFMQVADYFAPKLSTMDNLPALTVAYLLAQVSTPDAVREAVLFGEIPQSIPAIKAAIEAAKQSEQRQEHEQGQEGCTEEWLASLTERQKSIRQSLVRAGLDIGRALSEVAGVLSAVQLQAWAKAEFHMDSQDIADLAGYYQHYKDTRIEDLPQASLWEIAGSYASYMGRYLEKASEP